MTRPSPSPDVPARPPRCTAGAAAALAAVLTCVPAVPVPAAGAAARPAGAATSVLSAAPARPAAPASSVAAATSVASVAAAAPVASVAAAASVASVAAAASVASVPAAAPVASVASDYRLPLDPPTEVDRGFAPPPAPWAAGHRGVDLRTSPGTVVRAPGAGTVTFAGVVAGRGVVTVAHPDGRRSSLEPVSSTSAVGSTVAAGDPLGVVDAGASHCAPATCLHWGVRRGDVYLDPMALVDRGPIVLLPLR